MVRYRNAAEMSFTAQTTGGATVDISNSGYTVITSTAAERYVLAPPVAGAEKTIVFMQSGTTGRLIELSSLSSGDSVTLVHTTGGATATEIIYEATVQGFVKLLGLSTSQWLLVDSGFGQAASTGIVFQAS